MDIRQKLIGVINNISQEKLDSVMSLANTISDIMGDPTFRDEFSEEHLQTIGELLAQYDESDIGAYFISELSK